MSRICKNKVQINCASITMANQYKDDLPDFMRSRFYLKLEELLDEFDTNSKTLEIGNLQIAFEIKNQKQWKNEFLHQALSQIRLFLRQQSSYRGPIQNYEHQIDPIANRHIEPATIDLIIYFLKTGNLTHNQNGKHFDQILKKMEWTLQDKAQVFKAIATNAQAILRFVFSIPKNVRTKILEETHLEFNFSNRTNRNSYLDSNRFSSEFKDFMEVIHQLETVPKILNKNFVHFLKINFKVTEKEYHKWLDTQTNPIKTKFKKLEATKKNNSTENEAIEKDKIHHETMYYINNAGLILVHHFLQNIFSELDYLEVDRITFKSKQFQNRAVLLTQYLINFEERIFETDLVLNKVLCGLKITDAINTKVEFSDREKDLCRELLVSIIAHWKILKNTSPESLQESFLQRNAKLKSVENTWRLTVEKSGIDVLLNHLPWGTGTIKTPWMKLYLTCNWNG